MSKVRIQKLLAEAGVASRRAIEEMIVEGRISVNDELVSELPCFVDPETDDIAVDGKPVKKRAQEKVYFLLNKPRGVVCTSKDPQGRPRAIDLVPAGPLRVYTVGRLDEESTGVILLTNDGDLTQRLTHPRHGVEKTYVIEVDRAVSGDDVEQMKRGIYLDGKRTQPAWVKVLRRSHERTLLEVKIGEGRNRELRRVLAKLGYKVRRLKRVAIGPVTDRGIKIGNWRMLTRREVDSLWRATEPGAQAESGEEEAKPRWKPPRKPRAGKQSKRPPKGGGGTGRSASPPGGKTRKAGPGAKPRPSAKPRPGGQKPKRGGPAGSARPGGGRKGRPKGPRP
jgi:23S rRNA pseudouridine2605 synthase